MATLARWQSTIVDEGGLVQSAASVEVRRESDNVLVTLYTDRAGTISAGNPVLSDSEGYVYFHVADGVYKITATKAAFSRIWRYVGVSLFSESSEINLNVTNPVVIGRMESFDGTGYTVKGTAAFASTWEAGNGGLNGATLVVDAKVNDGAGTVGAPGAIFAGVRITDDITPSGGFSPPVQIDPYGIVSNVYNDTAVATPHGVALWGIIRGKKASSSDVDAIRATSELDTAENPRCGLFVYNNLATNAFDHGVWVYSSKNYGIRVGGSPSVSTQVQPSIPIGVQRTVGVTTADGLVLENETAAAVGAQQYSPRLRWRGYGWKTNATAASQSCDWFAEARPYQAAVSPGVDLVFSFNINAGSNFDQMTLRAGGGLGLGTEPLAATLVGGDLQLARSSTAGAVAFGSSGAVYLFYTGTIFDMTGGNLVVASGSFSKHATAGLGYSTGAGGTITQTGSRTTAVTVDKVTGAITLVSAAGSATYSSFTVNNSSVAATDVVIVNQKSGTDLYEIHVTAVAAGSFRITSRTTGGTTSEQPVFNFAVVKGVTS